MTLKDLKKGERATIKKIVCKDAIKKRLFDMGVINGAQVQYLRQAPLGDPLLIKVRGVLLAIRKSVAKDIIVEGIKCKDPTKSR